MRTIHIITPEYLPHVGGVGDYTRVFAGGLARVGEDVHVWTPVHTHGSPGDRFTVHPEMGSFSHADLARVDELLNAFAAPRRILVQWVPHAYGYKAMNVGFCMWLTNRAARGDRIEVMVHEPYLDMWEGTWRQTGAAMVHRVMTVMLLRAARKVWLSIPAWEPKLKPYALRKQLPFGWLPIPSSLNEPRADHVQRVRYGFGAAGRPIVGHLGTYGSMVTPLLRGALLELLQYREAPQVLLIGEGSQSFRAVFLADYPLFGNSIHATGRLPDDELAAHVAACDIVLQPYPDGVSGRRTTAMAALQLGIPIVTTTGHLTEAIWEQSGAVRLTKVGDHEATARMVLELLRDSTARWQLSRAGLDLYARRFDLSRTIDALMSFQADAAA